MWGSVQLASRTEAPSQVLQPVPPSLGRGAVELSEAEVMPPGQVERLEEGGGG